MRYAFRRKVICVICHKPRIVSTFDRAAIEEIKQEIGRGYICSDHETGK